MKRYIRSMSFERRSAEKHVRSYQKVATDHIIEIVVYKNSSNDYNHWIDELSAWFVDINDTDLKIKRNPPKFKWHEYEEFVFGLLGQTTSDAKGALLSYKANNIKYPDFEIDRNLVLNLRGAASDLSDKMCGIWSTFRSHSISTEEMNSELHSILDPYVE